MALDPCDPFEWLSAEPRIVTRSLEGYFANPVRRCDDPENLAGEVVGRLAEKLMNDPALWDMPVQNRKAYLWGIARNVYREWRRRPEWREISLESEEIEQSFLAGANEQSDQNPLQQILEKDRQKHFQAALAEALSSMNESDAELIRSTSSLNEEQRPTLEALAKTYSIETAAMRKRKSRALARLQETLTSSPRWTTVQHYWQAKVKGGVA